MLCSGDTYSNGSTGGSASHYHGTQGHTLTIAEIPSHPHAVTSRMSSQGYNHGSSFIIDNWWNDPAGNEYYKLMPSGVVASVTDGY